METQNWYWPSSKPLSLLLRPTTYKTELQFLTLSQALRKTTQVESLVTGSKHRRGRAPQGWSCYSTQQHTASRASDSHGWATMAPLTETPSYLGFHLCSLLWIHCQDVLVVADGVQPVLVLGTDVALQGLQDAVGLQDGSREQVTGALESTQTRSWKQHFRCEPTLVLWTDLSHALILWIFKFFFLIKPV